MARGEAPKGYRFHPFLGEALLIPVTLEFELRRERDAQRASARAEVLGEPEEPPTPAEPAIAAGGEHSGDDYPVYCELEVEQLARRVHLMKDGENRARIQRIVKALEGSGSRRRIVHPAGPEALRSLRQSHPHFEAPIASVERRLYLARETQTPPRLPAILLLGSPGIGKSHFARALALAVAGTFTAVSFDTGVENSALVGLDKHWGNTHHGILFEQLCLGKWANPVILLEELDKTHRYSDHNPLDALHTLLEPSTAGAVRDLSLEFVFDASLVTYVATANELSTIPDSLQSRFEIFEIGFPSAEQAIQIARQVVARTIAELAPPGFAAASEKIHVLVAHLTAREIRSAIGVAIANAVFNGRLELRLSDLPAHIVGRGDEKNWLH